jgi:hypothetical protein
MTAIQLSKLKPQNRQGEVVSYLANQKGKKVYYLRSYINVNKMLNRWEDDLWKRIDQRNNDPDLWTLPEERRRAGKPHEDLFRTTNLLHDLGVADLYCSLYPHNYEDGQALLTEWDRDKTSPQFLELYYDARLLLYGQEMFFEHERGNHAILEKGKKVSGDYYSKSLNKKLDNYVAYFDKHPFSKRLLLITVEDWSGGYYDAKGTEEYLADVVSCCARYPIAERILVARHRDVVGDREHTEGEIHNEVMGDPLGAVWLSSTDPQDFVSISDALRHLSK